MAVRMFSNIKNINAVPTKFPNDTIAKEDINVKFTILQFNYIIITIYLLIILFVY